MPDDERENSATRPAKQVGTVYGTGNILTIDHGGNLDRQPKLLAFGCPLRTPAQHHVNIEQIIYFFGVQVRFSLFDQVIEIDHLGPTKPAAHVGCRTLSKPHFQNPTAVLAQFALNPRKPLLITALEFNEFTNRLLQN